MPTPLSFKKIIIIKTGQYETFTTDHGSLISLGDVFRSTSLLSLKRLFSSNTQIHWFTSPQAMPLLPIDGQIKAEVFNLHTMQQLLNTEPCLVVNLERSLSLKNSHFFNNFDHGTTHQLVGFINDDSSWKLQDHLQQKWSLDVWLKHCAELGKNSWGEMLSFLLGHELPIKHGIISKPPRRSLADIGINWKAGSKWPSKSVALSEWEQLANKLSQKYRISWQKGFDNIDDYIDWISSNRLIISLDSLGLHLATSLKIPVIGLFGHTSPAQIDFGGPAVILNYQYNTLRKIPIENILSSVDKTFVSHCLEQELLT